MNNQASDLTSKTIKTSELKKIAIEQHRIIMQIMEGKNVTKQLQQYAKKCLTDRKFLEIMNPMNNQASEARKKRMSQEQKWLAYVTDLRNKHDQELADLRQQLKQERNKAIEEAIELFKASGFNPEDYNGNIAFEILENLKNK